MLPDEGENMSNSEIKADMFQKQASSSERGLHSFNPSIAEQRVLNVSCRRDPSNLLSLTREEEPEKEGSASTQNKVSGV